MKLLNTEPRVLDAMSPTKRLEDLPQFRIAAVSQLQIHDDGKIDLEIRGTFDRINGIHEGSCWLLLPERECLMGDFKFEDVDAKQALFFTSERTIPNLIGLSLPYLSGRWESYHVWMVIEPKWTWNRVLFQASDARARRFQEQGVSIVDGQEVREWIEIRKIGEENEGSRVYPVFSSGEVDLPAVGPDGIIKRGWSHEHCEICSRHIDSGQYGYRDLGGHKVCESCHGQYIVPHDLSFLDRF